VQAYVPPMPIPATPLFPWTHADQHRFEAELTAHVADRLFPCVGAKSALARGKM